MGVKLSASAVSLTGSSSISRSTKTTRKYGLSSSKHFRRIFANSDAEHSSSVFDAQLVIPKGRLSLSSSKSLTSNSLARRSFRTFMNDSFREMRISQVENRAVSRN